MKKKGVTNFPHYVQLARFNRWGPKEGQKSVFSLSHGPHIGCHFGQFLLRDQKMLDINEFYEF